MSLVNEDFAIKPLEGMKAGLRISFRNGTAYFDFTDEEISNALAQLLSPKFIFIFYIDYLRTFNCGGIYLFLWFFAVFALWCGIVPVSSGSFLFSASTNLSVVDYHNLERIEFC